MKEALVALQSQTEKKFNEAAPRLSSLHQRPKGSSSSSSSKSKNSEWRKKRETLGIRADAQWSLIEDDDYPEAPKSPRSKSPRPEDEGHVEQFTEIVHSLKSTTSSEIERMAQIIADLRAELKVLSQNSADDLMQERIAREKERLRLEEEAERLKKEAEEERRKELERIKGVLTETQAEGYVFKKGKLMGAWKKNYLLMRDNTLYFFRSVQQAHEARPKPTSIISCDLIRVYEGTIQDDRYECIELANLEKDSDRIVLGFSSATEKNYWIKAIKDARKKRVIGAGILDKNE